MDLQPNKTDGVIKPITNTRISASEWNQLVGSCMEFITEAGFTPDAEDNAQFLNAFKAIAANLELIGANTNLSNLTATGEAHFAKPSLSNVLHTSGYRPLIEVYHSGTEWYKVFAEYDPSTGNFVGNWCEQGGKITDTTAGAGNVKTYFHKPYSNTNYTITLGNYSSYGSDFAPLYISIQEKANDYFKTTYGSGASPNKDWYACGYL